jgi:membrane-bound inhibitor of C-type lysozyme
MYEVTTMSKAIAMILFVTLPFIGGWIGYHFAPTHVVEVEKIVTVREEQRNEAPGAPPTERFVGTIANEEILFEHMNYTSYRLVRNGVVTTGELNTERGFEDDIDATVYVLDWQKPELEHTLFVRLTGESSVHPLTSTRQIFGTDTLTKMNDPVTFSCLSGDSITASFAPNAVYLELSDGRAAVLPQTISGSGARYANADESFIFWNKGNSAFIEEGNTVTYSECATGE